MCPKFHWNVSFSFWCFRQMWSLCLNFLRFTMLTIARKLSLDSIEWHFSSLSRSLSSGFTFIWQSFQFYWHIYLFWSKLNTINAYKIVHESNFIGKLWDDGKKRRKKIYNTHSTEKTINTFTFAVQLNCRIFRRIQSNIWSSRVYVQNVNTMIFH